MNYLGKGNKHGFKQFLEKVIEDKKKEKDIEKDRLLRMQQQAALQMEQQRMQAANARNLAEMRAQMMQELEIEKERLRQEFQTSAAASDEPMGSEG